MPARRAFGAGRDGNYAAWYNVTVAGAYSMAVVYPGPPGGPAGDVHIKFSPFSIRVGRRRGRGAAAGGGGGGSGGCF